MASCVKEESYSGPEINLSFPQESEGFTAGWLSDMMDLSTTVVADAVGMWGGAIVGILVGNYLGPKGAAVGGLVG